MSHGTDLTGTILKDLASFRVLADQVNDPAQTEVVLVAGKKQTVAMGVALPGNNLYCSGKIMINGEAGHTTY